MHSQKFNRKRFDLHQKVLFFCTAAVGHSICESDSKAAVPLTSDEEWSVCRTTRWKEAFGNHKDRLAFDGWVTSKYHDSGIETVWEYFTEGGDPILNVFCRELLRVKLVQLNEFSGFDLD